MIKKITFVEKKTPICLHFHIFKNAGSTIEWILEKNFLDNAITFDPKNVKEVFSNQEIINYLEQNPNVQSFSSHQIRFPTPTHPKFHFIPILFIRHPIDRAISVYNFNRRRHDAPDRPGVKKAKTLTLNEYLEWSIKQKKFKATKNFQTLFLSDKDVESDVNDIDFKIAENRIQNCQITGVVDRFDESLVLGESLLQNYFPKIDLSYIQKNVSPGRSGNFKIDLEKNIKQIDKHVKNKLEKVNELDFKLYAIANKELDKRISEIKNFESKLSKFQERCRFINKIAN